MKKQLNKSEIQNLKEKIKEKYGIELFSKKDKIEITEKNNIKIILKEGKPIFFYHKEEIVPTIKLLQENNFLKTITIDMGAVRFVANGADVMRPGITRIKEGIEKGENVAVTDEKYNKIIAVCKTLYSGEEIKKMDKGKVLENLHYVGDKIWESI
ncbi:RNA-binding protein [Candidatus Woesearchaeota archaeon]|nr:MAG: RNA-binding protein [Candidatus Woesearchaeota archaeon ex4484_78]RLE46285.1 MAG: RNA-binding protein [Candidatus Woesearchaeota archaeon]